MKIEKLMNSWFFRFSEKLYQLIILNIISSILIVLGLGVFTIMPVLVSLIIILKNDDKNTTIPFLKVFFKSFKRNYEKAELLSIPFYILILIFSFNVYYFYNNMPEDPSVYITIFYYVSLIFDVILILAFINACFVFVYFPHLSYLKKIKYSFKLLYVVIIKTLIIFALLIAFIYISFLFIYLPPLILISLFIYIVTLLLDRTYKRLIPEGYNCLNAEEYY